ncbi:hypothetical protein AX14_009164 [Amanita brunnescens Koide BX004]|nr:hypothetical protein AX14_009164 [Amanita brunnescens Koide BX004]
MTSGPQEAVLYALANLAKDNPTVVLALENHSPDKDAATPALSTVIHGCRGHWRAWRP